MAISKTIPTNFGIDINHTVIKKIEISRETSQLIFNVVEYPTATNFNNGNNALGWKEYTFLFNQLPVSIITKILELKNLIEVEMIANLPEWSGGIQVNDDGSPI